MRRTLLFGVFGLVLLLVLLNGVSRNLLSRYFIDFTEDRLYTLSQGTRNILASADRDVTLKYYYSKTDGGRYPTIKLFGSRILDLLRQYERYGGGRIKLEIYDPRPDSEDEEWADRYGLSSIPGQGGEKLFLGLVAVSSLGDEEAIPLFNFGRQEYLEYDISRALASVINPKKPVVGVLSSLELLGSPDKPDEGWIVFQQLQQTHQVTKVPTNTTAIDNDVDLLLVVHPKKFSDDTLFAIDQFVMRGGNLIAFLDPYANSDIEQQSNPENPFAGVTQDRSSNLNSLTKKWGVELIEGRVIADLELAARVQAGEGEIRSFVVWPNLTRNQVDGSDLITSSLENLVLPWAGAFRITSQEGIKVETLLKSSSRSQLIEDVKVKFGGGEPDALLRNFVPGGEVYPLAVRLQGKLKSNYAESQRPGVLKEAESSANILLVSDVDMLSDRFSVQVQRIFGTKVAQPINDNLNFFLNSVENLLGSDDLVSIRSRGQFSRPFTVVELMEAQAQQRWQLEEMTLQAELNAANQRLSELQSKADSNQILSKAVIEEIEKFKANRRDAQKRLREVRKNLRQDIEGLGQRLFLLNTFLVPVLLVLLAVGLSYRKES
jgi:ABC-type uncharacterized transport system involved in gliding motility auxiliary subunit